MANPNPGSGKKRIRYILCGRADPDDPICHFRLVSAPMLSVNSDHGALRVILPEDLKLTKLSCDPYSTTDDTRTLRQLGAIPVVKVNGRWTEMSDLWPDYPPCEWFRVLYTKGLYGTLSPCGYLHQGEYKKYLSRINLMRGL